MDIEKFMAEVKQLHEESGKKDVVIKALTEKCKEQKSKYDELKTVLVEIFGKCNTILTPPNFKPGEVADTAVIPGHDTKAAAEASAKHKAEAIAKGQAELDKKKK